MPALVVSTEPAEEPVTRAEAKSHLRIDDTNSDALIDLYIISARQLAEKFLNRTLVTTVYKYYMDAIKGSTIRLPKPPLQSVASVISVSKTAVETTFSSANYVVDTKSSPGRVVLKEGQTWPTDVQEANGYYVTFTAGYGAASTVPEAIKMAIKMIVAEWFEHRQEAVEGTVVQELPMTVKRILYPYRVWEL